MAQSRILIEGYTRDELAAFDDLEALVLNGEPIVFRIGSANVLGQFSRDDSVLTAEVAVVENGGEGVLPALIDAVERWSRAHGVGAIEWIVYATDCAEPNPKLTSVLERLGFIIRILDNGAQGYWRRVSANDTMLRLEPRSS